MIFCCTIPKTWLWLILVNGGKEDMVHHFITFLAVHYNIPQSPTVLYHLKMADTQPVPSITTTIKSESTLLATFQSLLIDTLPLLCSSVPMAFKSQSTSNYTATATTQHYTTYQLCCKTSFLPCQTPELVHN